MKPANPRPAGFDGNSVTIYEYAGEGPVDWRSRYKQQMRQQLEQILKTDSENGILNTGQDSETGLWEHKTVQL